jgi:hypothetical protein
VSDAPNEANRTELRITGEEARSVAALLRYAISLNTTVGLVSPTQRRLATPTYKAVELAEYLEVQENQFLELLGQRAAKKRLPEQPEG